MMNFVKSPNLPRMAKTILIGEKYSELMKKPLKNKGFLVVEIPDNPDVDKRLSGHADLSVLHVGENKLFLAPYLKGSAFAEVLKQMGFEIAFSTKTQSVLYPDDAGLNLCVCGKHLICNPKSSDSNIVDYLTKDRGLNFLAVKQGYSKCSVCVVNENAIITSDALIHKRAVEAGIESLKIIQGFVDLDGFEYGFIGGASFKLSADELAFTGNLEGHPNKEDIEKFLSLHNVKAVYITNKPAFDIGSALQIVEKDSLN